MGAGLSELDVLAASLADERRLEAESNLVDSFEDSLPVAVSRSDEISEISLPIVDVARSMPEPMSPITEVAPPPISVATLPGSGMVKVAWA